MKEIREQVIRSVGNLSRLPWGKGRRCERFRRNRRMRHFTSEKSKNLEFWVKTLTFKTRVEEKKSPKETEMKQREDRSD